MEFPESGLLKLMSNNFKSRALRTTEITMTAFELSISPLQNAIYFSIIPIPKKSYSTIFTIKNIVQNTKKTCEYHLYCWDHLY